MSFRCVLNVVVPLTEGQLRQEWSRSRGGGGVSVLGNRVLRTEDKRMLTEGARYVADLRFADQAHACFVRSTVAHGRLLGIHANNARAQPGVLGVFTAVDLDLPDLPPIPVVNQLMGRPALARDTVRFVGEPVAVVAAETAAAAADAAEYVVVDIEPLPAIVSVWAAAEADTSSVRDSRPHHPAAVSQTATTSSGLVHESAGTNLAFELPATGTAKAGLDFSECDVTVEVSMVSQRLAAVPLEPRSAAAEWSADGSRLRFYATTQAPHRVRDALAHLCSLDPEEVRVIVPDIGGGFGAKGQPTPEELLVAVLSRQVGRPVVWTESRAENLTSSVHGRAQHHRLRLGGTRRGRITHCELDVVQDAGAYPIIGAFLPTLTSAVFTGGYDIAAASIRGRSYVTNTAPIAAYRGAGRPDVAFALERAVDRFAAQVGMDPTEVRRMNLVRPDQFPFEAPSGSTYDSGDYETALDTALDAAGYGALRAEQSRRRAAADPVLLGVGVASYVESTSMGSQRAGRDRARGRRLAGGSHRSHRVRAGPRHLLGDDRIGGHRRADGPHPGHLGRHCGDLLQRADGRVSLGAAGRLGGADGGPEAGGGGPWPGRSSAGGGRGRSGARHRLRARSMWWARPSPESTGPRSPPRSPERENPRWRQLRIWFKLAAPMPSAAMWPPWRSTPAPVRRCCEA